MNNSIGSESLHGEMLPDLLHRKPLAEKFVIDLLEAETTQPYSMVSINGPWGSGKTHVLKQMGPLLTEKNRLVFGMSAWLYEPEGDLLGSMFRSLTDHENYVWDRHVTSLKNRLRLIKHCDSEYSTLLRDSMTLAGQLYGPANALGSIFEIADRIRSFFSVERTWPGIKRMRRSFQHLVDRIIDGKYERLYVFIDELERCSPPGMLRILEAASNLLNINNCTFVFAFDVKAAKTAVHGKYNQYIDNNDEGFGKKYLQKMFEQSYLLPDPLMLQRLIMNELGEKDGSLSEYVTRRFSIELSDEETQVFDNIHRIHGFINPRDAVRSARLFRECTYEYKKEGDKAGRHKYLKGNVLVFTLLAAVIEASGLGMSIGDINFRMNNQDMELHKIQAFHDLHDSGLLKIDPLTKDELSVVRDIVHEKKFFVLTGFSVEQKVTTSSVQK